MSTNLHARDSPQRPSRRFHTPVCMLTTSTASMSTGVTTQHPWTVRTWIPGQHPTILDCCITKRKQQVSSFDLGTSAPIQTWSSRVSARTADCSGKVPAVTTSAFPHNATKIQGSCPQRPGEALELSQDRLEALLPSYR